MIATRTPNRLDTADMILLIVFLLGFYSGVSIEVTSTIPFPAAPAGIAGMVLLWRRRDDMTQIQVTALIAVLLLYLASIFCATDLDFLRKRFTGFIQLSYSLIIAYAFFLTLLRADRGQLAKLFLGFCLVIVLGSFLEEHTGLRSLSDAVRAHLYPSADIYDSDLRDRLIYGRIRPKLFTSEPSAVTFSYTTFAFAWLMTSRWRWRVLGYLALFAVGVTVMPGPTLLLMLILGIPYQLLQMRRQTSIGMRIGICAAGLILVLGFVFIGQSLYAARLREITSGNDPSFFFREIGPMLIARDVFEKYPIAGIGLTGEPFAADEVMNVFMRSSQFSAAWELDAAKIADLLTNYFWLHWIYLGLLWGMVTAAGLSFWLKTLGVSSVVFCWAVWIVMGQASGSYVGPKTWIVLLLAAACLMLHDRGTAPAAVRAVRTAPRGPAPTAAPIGRRGVARS